MTNKYILNKKQNLFPVILSLLTLFYFYSKYNCFCINMIFLHINLRIWFDLYILLKKNKKHFLKSILFKILTLEISSINIRRIKEKQQKIESLYLHMFLRIFARFFFI